MFGKSFFDIATDIEKRWKNVSDTLTLTNDYTLKNISAAWKLGGSNPISFLTDDEVTSILDRYNKALDSGAEATARFLNSGTGNEFMDGFLKDLNGAPATMNKYKIAMNNATAQQKAFSVSTIATKAAVVALNAAVSLGLSIVLSSLVKTISEVIQAEENMKSSAKELGAELSNNISTIDNYKNKIEELKGVLGDSSSSFDDVAQARIDLMKIQDELIDKFGTEKGVIEDITEAIYGQTNALDDLSRDSYYKAKNEFNEKTTGEKFIDGLNQFLSFGYVDEDKTTSKMDKMVGQMESSLYHLKTTGNEVLDELIAKSYGLNIYDDMYGDDQHFLIIGSLDDIQEKLRGIQELSQDFDVSTSFENSLAEISNEVDSILNSYQNLYNQYVLYEKILTNNPDNQYDEQFNLINKAKEEYNNALKSGDTDAIQKASDNFAKTLSSAIDLAMNNQDYDVADYFEDMYPEMQQLFGEWKFKLDFEPNTEGIQDKVSNSLDVLEGFSSEDILNFNPNVMTDEQISAYGELNNVAEEYGLTLQQLINLLLEMGLVSSESYQNLVDKFGQDKINKIAQEDLVYAYEIKNLGDLTFEELLAEIQRLKAESTDETTDLWDYSETITQLDTIKEKFDTLDKTYSKLFDADKQIGFEDYSSINEAFSDLKGIETYIQRLQEAGQNQEEVTAVMEDLISAYLDYTGLLDNVTEENASLIEQTLTELGVLNSKELVLARLSGELINMSNAEEVATAHGLTLTDVTWEEINALVAEGSISEQVAQQLAYFAIQKQITNDTVISTDGDCQNLINLAKTAGYSESVLTRLEALKKRFSDPFLGKEMTTTVSNAIKNVLAEAEMDAESINFKLPEVKYNGGSSTKSAMDSAAKSAKEEFEELFDFFEQRVKVLNNAISLLETNLENVSGSFAKNTLLNQGISLNAEKINNYTDALAMYTQKANEALSKLPSDIAQKIQNGAVDLTNFVGDGNKDVVEAIKDYQSWADKISDCKQQLAELKETIRQLELDKFNNIVEDFSNIFDIRDDSKSLIEKQIGLLEEAGQLIGDSFYTTQIEQSQKQLALLEQEKANLTQQLTSALSSGNIQQGTDEWLEMVDTLTEVESSILDVKTEIEELDNALLNLHTEVFERIQEQFSNLSSELENLGGLFDDFEVADEKGNWSNEGLARLGLLTQQYELAQYQVQQYNEEIAELNKQYLAGRYSATEYADKLAELSEAQWEAVNSSEAILDSIISLNEARIDIQIEGINKEVEAYKELIDAQIEALEAEKDLHDYKKSIEEKTKDVTSLEKQIAALQYDTSASAKAKKALLEEQLVEARKDLEEAQYEHSIETQKDALNKQYEDFEKEKNAEIEALEESLKNREQLIANSFESVKANTDLVGQQIAVIAQQHGITVSDAIINSWKSGENAIASYGTILSAQTSSFVGQLMSVENEVYALQQQANSTGNTLAAVFSTRADNLVNELANSWYGTYNLNQMTNALQSSLSNALERGYNVSGITSALNSVTSAANSAKSALDALNNTPTTATTTSKPQNEYYYVDRNGNRSDIQKGNPPSSSNGSIVISKYASGTRSAKGGLSITDEEGYELKLPKLSSGNYTITGEGDQVLTKVQTDNIFEWSKFNPDMFVPQVSNNFVTPHIASKNVNNVVPSVHVGNLITVQGNVDSSNIKQMEIIANKAVNNLVDKMYNGKKYGSY